MIDIFLTILILFFSIKTYLTDNKNDFLTFNIITIIFISLSFYINNGIVGFYTEIGMLIINISAFFISKELENKLKITIPILSFLLIVYINADMHSIAMPLAISLFIIGIYQSNIIYNKVFFVLGLMSLFMYANYINDTNVQISSFIGILINGYMIFKLKYQNGSRKEV